MLYMKRISAALFILAAFCIVGTVGTLETTDAIFWSKQTIGIFGCGCAFIIIGGYLRLLIREQEEADQIEQERQHKRDVKNFGANNFPTYL